MELTAKWQIWVWDMNEIEKGIIFKNIIIK